MELSLNRWISFHQSVHNPTKEGDFAEPGSDEAEVQETNEARRAPDDYYFNGWVLKPG